MLNDSVLKISPHGSFKVTQLCESVAICEAVRGDRNNWGNATETEPAFVTYLGCQKDEVKGYLKTLNTFYRCYTNEIRKPKYLKGMTVEIKIYAMQRYSDETALGLNYLVESQQWQEIGCNSDEYDYYTTGTQQRW
jgi:hypothetical protein